MWKAAFGGIMFLFDAFVAILLALAVFFLLSMASDGYAGGGLGWMLVLLLFLLIWAGGAFIGPLGIPIFGVFWLSFLVVAVVVGLLLAAMGGRTVSGRKGAPEAATDAANVGVTLFFRVLVIVLLIGLFTAYW